MLKAMDNTLRSQFLGIDVIVSPYVPEGTAWVFNEPELVHLPKIEFPPPVETSVPYSFTWNWSPVSPAAIFNINAITDAPVEDRRLQMWIGYGVLFLLLILLVLWGINVGHPF